jgi:hypothetical protein
MLKLKTPKTEKRKKEEKEVMGKQLMTNLPG